jgi:hypothetical protein
MAHHLLSDCSSPSSAHSFYLHSIIGRIIRGDRTRKILQEQQNKYWSGYFGNKAAWPDFTNNNPSTFTPQYPQWPPWLWTPKVTPPMSFPPSPAPAPSPAVVAKPLPLPAHDGNPSQSIALPPQPPAAVVPAGTGSRPVVAGVAPGAGHSGHVSRPVYVIAAAGASLLAAVSVALFVVCCRSSKVVTVRPWATGLSGQLQKAFVTGGPVHP